MTLRGVELRRVLIVGLPIVVLVVGALLFVGLSSLQPDRPEAVVQERTAPRVEVVPLAPRTVTLDVIGHGTVRPRDEVHLSVEVSGRVAFIASNLRPGSFVGQGELLVRLEGQEQKVAHQAAKADLARAAADQARLEALEAHLKRDVSLRAEQVKLARAEWKRQQKLIESGVSTPTQLERARRSWVVEETALASARRALALWPHDVARAQAVHEAAQAALDRAKHHLSQLELRAPFPAQVRARRVELGQIVSPNGPLVDLAGYGAYEVPVQLRHVDLVKLAKVPAAALPRGLSAPPGFAGRSPASVTWLAHPKRPWQGQLTRIESVDPKTRTVPAVVEVAQPWANLSGGGVPLLLGAYCRVRLLGQTREGAWVVPERALREGERVYVLRDARLAIVPVAVDHLLAGEVVITPREAFRPGDQLIVSRLTYPVAGMSLRVEAPAK